MHRKNVLVFPCGSEIGLEIYRSLCFSRFVNLYGGNSVDDHGRFVFENYRELPFAGERNFIPRVNEVVTRNGIDAIFPTMDTVITELSKHENEIGCKIIASPMETTKICLSKRRTYATLRNKVRTPSLYDDISEITAYPVFGKPDVGYGSRNVRLLKDAQQALAFKAEFPESIILEYISGNEFTVDCFTTHKRQLIFVGPRERKRISHGISVNTVPVSHNQEKVFHDMAKTINESIELRGAWFFQAKKNSNDELVLLEVASRIGGSSALYRSLGVNFALLSLFDAYEEDVTILMNDFEIELDRALNNKYKTDITFENIYLDLDDCLIIDGKINIQLISLLYQCLNEGIKTHLVTRYEGNLAEVLDQFRLTHLFDNIINITDSKSKKSDYINHRKSIFIDDSFSERLAVRSALNIPVFAPDAVECLLK